MNNLACYSLRSGETKEGMLKREILRQPVDSLPKELGHAILSTILIKKLSVCHAQTFHY